MTWATGYMLGITTGICLQIAAVQAERRNTRKKLTALVQDGTLRVADRAGNLLSGEQLVSALDHAIRTPDPATARRDRTLALVVGVVAFIVAVITTIVILDRLS